MLNMQFISLITHVLIATCLWYIIALKRVSAMGILHKNNRCKSALFSFMSGNIKLNTLNKLLPVCPTVHEVKILFSQQAEPERSVSETPVLNR